MSKQRCEKLKYTLQETKSIIGVNGGGSASKPTAALAAGLNKHASTPAVNGVGKSSVTGAAASSASASHGSPASPESYYSDDYDEDDTFEGDQDDGTPGHGMSSSNHDHISDGYGSPLTKQGSTQDISNSETPRASSRAPPPFPQKEPTLAQQAAQRSSNTSSNTNQAVKSSASSNSSSGRSAYMTPPDSPPPAIAARQANAIAEKPVIASVKAVSPSAKPFAAGRLGDRIRVLRQRCIEGLTEPVFDKVSQTTQPLLLSFCNLCHD